MGKKIYLQIEKLPTLIDDFLRRQAYPNSSKRSFIYEMAGEGVETPGDHVIQIGIRDNLEIGSSSERARVIGESD